MVWVTWEISAGAAERLLFVEQEQNPAIVISDNDNAISFFIIIPPEKVSYHK
jgi:hypothetical protein